MRLRIAAACVHSPRPSPGDAEADAALRDQGWLGSRSSELCSPQLATLPAHGQQQVTPAGCSQLLFHLIVVPELGELTLSGSFLVLKGNFLLVPGSLFLFLCLDKPVGGTFAWAKMNIGGGRQSPCWQAQGLHGELPSQEMSTWRR